MYFSLPFIVNTQAPHEESMSEERIEMLGGFWLSPLIVFQLKNLKILIIFHMNNFGGPTSGQVPVIHSSMPMKDQII